MTSTKRQTNLRLDPELIARAIAAAKTERRTLTNLVEFLLEQYLKGKEPKHARKSR